MEGNPALKFAYKYRQSIAFALYVSLLCSVAAPAVLAKPAPPAQPRRNLADVPAYAGKGVPLRRTNSPDGGKFIPEGVTRRSTTGVKGFDSTRLQVGGTNGANVQEQVVDITNFAGVISDEIDPFWSADEQFIFFSSNRDFTGDNNPDNNQLWRIPSNPSPNQAVALEPARLTNQSGAIHRFPAINAANRIAFIKSLDNGGSYQLYSASVPAGATGATPAANVPSVTVSPTIASLTAGFSVGTGAAQRQILSVGRPAWLSATEIIFSAKLSDDQSDVLTVDIQTGLIRRVTNSPASEANVAVSPGGRYIAFDSNATGYSAGGPGVSTGITGNGTRNVFVATNFGSNAVQVTGGAGSGVAADVSNVQPAWSRSEVTPFFQTQNTFYLAFASDRIPATAPATGFTRNPNGSKDIYYANVVSPNVTGTDSQNRPIVNGLRFQLEGDAASVTFPGITVVTGNVAPLYLDTNDDPRYIKTDEQPYRWDDAYPTFPPLLNAIRIAFQSNRKGTTLGRFAAPSPNTDANRHDIFLASVLDLFAPTLLRYDLTSQTGEVVHINLGNTFNPSVGASVRNRSQGLTPGTEVFFTVRGEDLESGIRSAYIQIKNPNSKYQSQAQGGDGREHKEYGYGAFAIYEPITGGAVPLPWEPGIRPGLNDKSRNVGLEYECQVLGASDNRYYSHGLVPGILFGGGAGLNVPRNTGSMYDAGGGVFTIGNLFDRFLVGDDGQAFSGTAHPAPLDANGNNIWVELKRIDTISAEMATQYPGGRDSNGGVLYGAAYRTSGEPSDWFLDVIFYDNAVNPFNPTGSRGNWIIYDNVWGFSTAPAFSALPVDILVVSDYMLGQKFLGGRLNRRGAAGQQSQRPEDNLPNIIYGGESYITDSDVKRFLDGQPAPSAPEGTTLRQWEGGGIARNPDGSVVFEFPGGPFFTGLITVPSPSSFGNGGTPNPLGVGSYIDTLLQQDSVQFPGEGTDGTSRYLPSVGRYNIWRVLSRGPVPANVLNDYLPFNTAAPPDTRAGETSVRNVRNVNRLVIWASSFTQIAYRGLGTIADLQTQQDLTNYVNAGGQLFVSGQDVAFALAGNGQANTFLNQVLGVGFASDNAGGAFQLTVNAPGLPGTPVIPRNLLLANRIGRDSLAPGVASAFHLHNGTLRSYSPPGSEALDLQNFEDLLPFTDWRGSASGIASARAGGPLFNGFNDVVTAQTATPIAGFAGNGGMFVNLAGTGGTAVFASFGFESLTEGFYTYSLGAVPVLAWRGRRSGIMHNITDSLRTATITGRVLDDNNSPVTDALIRISNNRQGLGVGTAPNLIGAEGTGLTDSDGNFQVTGLNGGFVLVEAFKAGFYTQVSTGNVVHGGSRATVNLIVKRAGPGRLAGVRNTATAPLNKTRTNPDGTPRTAGGVFESDDVTPITGVPVLAFFAQASATGTRYVGVTTVTSDGTQRDASGDLVPAGQYIFPQDLPIGNYQLVVNTTRVIDADGRLVENTGQTSVTINGQAVQIPAARTGFAQNVYAELALVGRRAPGQTGIDLRGDDPATAGANEATILLANPNKTGDLLGDFVVIEENKSGGVDFRLPAGAQEITGFVLAEAPNGGVGAGVPGVTVRATVRGNTTVVGEAVTDANGAFSLIFNNNTPDDASDDTRFFNENTYTVSVVSASGYDLVAEPAGRSRRPSVDVKVGGDRTVKVEIKEERSETQPLTMPGALIIEKLPPGSVSGLVSGFPRSTPVEGATVRLYVADSAGNRVDFDGNAANGITPRYTTLTVVIPEPVPAYRFNYKFDTVETGTYVADVSLRGFSPSPILSSVITVTSGNETRNVNFTLEPPKIYGGGVQLISIPIEYPETSAAATDPRLIFGLRTNFDNNGSGGNPDKADQDLFDVFRVADWADPEYRIGASIPLVRGKGYFVRFGGDTPVTNSEGVAPEGNELQVTLSAGWNLIGHPFARTDNPYALPADIDLATGTRFTGPDGIDSTFDQAVAKGYIRGIAYGYTGEGSGSQYFQSSVLKPWLGYWFRNTSEQTVQMRFLRPNEAAATTRSVKGRKPGSAVTRAEQEKIRFRSIDSKSTLDWSLQLAVRQGDLLDTDNSIGVKPGAKDGFDTQFDTEKPPVMTAAPMVYLSVEGKNATGGRAVLADDIRDGSQVGVGKRTWDFNVQPAEGKGEVTVFWPNVNRLPRGIEPFLVDVATGKRLPMRSASSYKYTPTGEEMGGRSVHRFRVEVAKPSSVPLMLTNVRQTRVDGGGRGVGQGGGYRIAFKVTRESDVTAEIQTLTGRTMTRLTTRGRSVGESVLFWNGRSQEGAELPAGAYLLTLTAKDADGSVVQVRQPILSLR